MTADILIDCPLSRRQVQLLLQVSQSTVYRWITENQIPHQSGLILRSVAHGLPVLMSWSHWWRGYRFAADGSLRRPNDYPLYPGDLWLYEFLNLNGEIRRCARRHGVEHVACVP